MDEAVLCTVGSETSETLDHLTLREGRLRAAAMMAVERRRAQMQAMETAVAVGRLFGG